MKKELLAFKARTNTPAIIGYIPAMYPDYATADRLLNFAYNSGLRFIEIGFPVAEPKFDGEIIRSAINELNRRNLGMSEYIVKSGINIRNSGLHGIAMLYEESLLEYGIEDFASAASANGFAAVLVPNISAANRKKLYIASERNGIEIVNFIGFNSSKEQIRAAAAETTGFIYLQSTEGATGGQFTADQEIRERLLRARKIASEYELPIALGFGINNRIDAEQAAGIGADAIIIGTSFLKAVQSGDSGFSDFLSQFDNFLKEDSCLRSSL